MSPRDLVYVGHMLDMAQKAVSKTRNLPRESFDADENLRLADSLDPDHRRGRDQGLA